MRSLLFELTKPDVWDAYLDHKRAHGQLTKREDAQLEGFIREQAWMPVARRLLAADASLGIPEKRYINKLGKKTKRVVYCFPPPEQQVLKVLAWLLYKYDDAQPPQCFSFRQGSGAHKAIRYLTRHPQRDQVYCYKLDVHDYFNSINVEKLLPFLADVISDDEHLYEFLASMLKLDKAVFEGTILREKRGVMAGTPTAPFLANIYLGNMDRHLSAQAVAYARYSDDIIMFARSSRELDRLSSETEDMLARYGLRANPEKEQRSLPGEAWEFLGISYQGGTIDLSKATQKKLKGKIRRKARALRRWMLRKDATWERAAAAMIRSMNRKFFEGGGTHELTWSRWFFPLITTSESLATLDAYLQQELRTIATGKHQKSNYRVSYEKLKELGYRNLVNEYYRFREQREKECSKG